MRIRLGGRVLFFFIEIYCLGVFARAGKQGGHGIGTVLDRIGCARDIPLEKSMYGVPGLAVDHERKNFTCIWNLGKAFSTGVTLSRFVCAYHDFTRLYYSEKESFSIYEFI